MQALKLEINLQKLIFFNAYSSKNSVNIEASISCTQSSKMVSIKSFQTTMVFGVEFSKQLPFPL